MAEKFEALFNSVKLLCAEYIEATHVLPYMSFIRASAGQICKAHKISQKDGFELLYDVLMKNNDEDKWRKYYEALKEAEFNSICKLYEFIDSQTENVNSYCKMFLMFSSIFTEDRLNVTAFATNLKSIQVITEDQLEEIKCCNENEGIYSAAILLLAYFPCPLSSLITHLTKCFKLMDREDLLKDMEAKFPPSEIPSAAYIPEEEGKSQRYSEEMIKHCIGDIIESVHPRDIWNQLAIDLQLPKNHIGFTENRNNIEKIMDLFEKSDYVGKNQSLYQVLSDAGYEQICLKLAQEAKNEKNNRHYKNLLATQIDLKKDIMVNDILEPLTRAKLINQNDKKEIESLNERSHLLAAECLLERVPLKKDMWYKSFFKILIENNQADIVNKIDPDFISNGKGDSNFSNNLETDSASDNEDQAQAELETDQLSLRPYQEELISKAILGKNCILAAPTGSGKTVMALKIIENHFQNHISSSRKVVFLCNQTTLVDQQENFLKKNLPHNLKVISVFGNTISHVEKKEMFRTYDIIVMTPQSLVDDLLLGRHQNFSIITLLIIDECHHTYAKHPYNVLMSMYIDDKIDNKNYPLPQVIGLTALVGFDVKKKDKSAKEQIREVCANMDCENLCIVKKCIESLNTYINIPEEYIIDIEQENNCNFSKKIKEFMDILHSSLDTSVLPSSLLSYGNNQYIGWLSDAKKCLQASTLEFNHEFASLFFLENCNAALNLVKGYRVSDALNMLHEYLASESLDTDACKNLKQMLQSKLNEFEKDSTQREIDAESKCFLKLVDVIKEQFNNKRNSQVIVFVETKQMARILQKALAENSEISYLNPLYLMASMTRGTEPGMSINRQIETLSSFQKGICKLLVSTPIGEEGLDIKKCNVVIDYMTVLGVRSHVQKRGRARSAHSKYIMIVGADPTLKKKAEGNQFKSDTIFRILDQVYDEQMTDPISFRKCLKQIQIKNKNERANLKDVKVENLNDIGIFTLKCISCLEFAAKSSDFRSIEEKCYVIVNPDFRNKISISRHNPKVLYDNVKTIGIIFCPKCNYKWGIQVVYKGSVFDCVKIKNFKIFNEKNEHIVAKRWLHVPFKNVVRPISTEEFESVEGAVNDYENAVLESSSDEN